MVPVRLSRAFDASATTLVVANLIAAPVAARRMLDFASGSLGEKRVVSIKALEERSAPDRDIFQTNGSLPCSVSIRPEKCTAER